MIDLVDFSEMLHVPSERQHAEAGRSLVFSVFWVRDVLHHLQLCFHTVLLLYASVTLNVATCCPG